MSLGEKGQTHFLSVKISPRVPISFLLTTPGNNKKRITTHYATGGKKERSCWLIQPWSVVKCKRGIQVKGDFARKGYWCFPWLLPFHSSFFLLQSIVDVCYTTLELEKELIIHHRSMINNNMQVYLLMLVLILILLSLVCFSFFFFQQILAYVSLGVRLGRDKSRARSFVMGAPGHLHSPSLSSPPCDQAPHVCLLQLQKKKPDVYSGGQDLHVCIQKHEHEEEEEAMDGWRRCPLLLSGLAALSFVCFGHIILSTSYLPTYPPIHPTYIRISSCRRISIS